MARLSRAKTAPRITLLGALDTYLLAVDAAGHSPATVATYRYAVRALVAVTGDTRLSDVGPDDLRRAIVGLRTAGRQPKTLRTYAGGWSAFFAWCVDEELIAASPMARVGLPAVPEVEPPGLGPDDMRRLLAACPQTTPVGARDRALLLTLYATGLRAAELLQLRRDDLLREDEGHQYLRVRGKGNRDRLIVVQAEAREAIGRYLLLRGQDGDPALWLGERGPLSVGGLYQICRRSGDRAGIKGVHPHRFRRAALGSWLDAGLPEADVQRLAGHRTAAMTRHYTAFSQQRRANAALLEVAPLSKLNLKRKRGR